MFLNKKNLKKVSFKSIFPFDILDCVPYIKEVVDKYYCVAANRIFKNSN